MVNESANEDHLDSRACPSGFYRVSHIVFSCLGGQGRARFYHMPGGYVTWAPTRTLMLQVFL